jgi:hypothetical protein
MAKVKKGLPSSRRSKELGSSTAPETNPIQHIASIKANSFRFGRTHVTPGSNVYLSRVTELGNQGEDELAVALQRTKPALSSVRDSSQTILPAPSTPDRPNKQPVYLNGGSQYLPSPSDSDNSGLSASRNDQYFDGSPSPDQRVISGFSSMSIDNDVIYTGRQLKFRPVSHTWTTEERKILCIVLRFFKAERNAIVDIMNARFDKCLVQFRSGMLISQYNELTYVKRKRARDEVWDAVLDIESYDQAAKAFQPDISRLEDLAEEFGIRIERRTQDDPRFRRSELPPRRVTRRPPRKLRTKSSDVILSGDVRHNVRQSRVVPVSRTNPSTPSQTSRPITLHPLNHATTTMQPSIRSQGVSTVQQSDFYVSNNGVTGKLNLCICSEGNC